MNWKLNQRLFTSTYRRHSVLLNTNERRKNLGQKRRSRQSSWQKSQMTIWSNKQCWGNNSTDDISELHDEMETGSINNNFRNAFYFVTRINLFTFLLFRVPPSIRKKSKLQTTTYCCQKLPFRCFSVVSSSQQIYFLFINITFLFNAITFCVCRHDSWKCFYGKMLAVFQPTETRGRNTRKLGYLHLRFENPHIFKKTKKTTHKLFV